MVQYHVQRKYCLVSQYCDTLSISLACVNQVAERVAVLEGCYQIKLNQKEQQQVQNSQQYPHRPSVNSLADFVWVHQGNVNQGQNGYLQDGFKQIQTDVNQGKHALQNWRRSLFVFEFPHQQPHQYQSDQHEGEYPDVDWEVDFGVAFNQVVDWDVVHDEFWVLEDSGVELATDLVSEGEMDDLEGFYEPEECEGDIVDFDMFEEFVGKSEKSKFEFILIGFLLCFHRRRLSGGGNEWRLIMEG